LEYPGKGNDSLTSTREWWEKISEETAGALKGKPTEHPTGEMLVDFAADTVDPQEGRAIAAHLAVCPDCATEAMRLETTWENQTETLVRRANKRRAEKPLLVAQQWGISALRFATVPRMRIAAAVVLLAVAVLIPLWMTTGESTPQIRRLRLIPASTLKGTEAVAVRGATYKIEMVFDKSAYVVVVDGKEETMLWSGRFTAGRHFVRPVDTLPETPLYIAAAAGPIPPSRWKAAVRARQQTENPRKRVFSGVSVYRLEGVVEQAAEKNSPSRQPPPAPLPVDGAGDGSSAGGSVP
jgi:hypothetical protein